MRQSSGNWLVVGASGLGKTKFLELPLPECKCFPCVCGGEPTWLGNLKDGTDRFPACAGVNRWFPSPQTPFQSFSLRVWG
jgi:hypothetical protein